MVQTSRSHDTATIRISGRFDFRCVKPFHAALDQGCSSWVVDMSAVEYIDSAALGLLLLLRERAGGEPGRVRIRHANGQPRDVLVMAKFDRMFLLED